VKTEQSLEAKRALLQRHQVEETVETNDAAPIINRQPQTLRRWACEDSGPIKPVRINGRLYWKVRELRALAAGEVVTA
jgi:hypothetical protein